MTTDENIPVSLPVAPAAESAKARANENLNQPPKDGERLHLLGSASPDLRRWIGEAGHPAFRADQILEWIYRHGADDFVKMTNLAKPLREWLAERAIVLRSTVTRDAASADGTRKLLLTWPDGRSIETVWIPDTDRNTVCVSSQVGCPVGCRFCASGMAGVERDLTPGEIVEQALRVQNLIVDQGRANTQNAGDSEARDGASRGAPRKALNNIVFMGMGEPLANYDNVLAAIRILNAPWGLNIGARKITVSTVGLPKQIRRLADEELQLNLALSLHAPFDDLRKELIPWAVPIDDLLSACEYYFDKTGREITFEYTLLANINDKPRHADKLAQIAKRLRANINLLRYNPVAGLPYERPDTQTALAFQNRLRERGVNAHTRRSRGSDIDAACGQLRRAALSAGGA